MKAAGVVNNMMKTNNKFSIVTKGPKFFFIFFFSLDKVKNRKRIPIKMAMLDGDARVANPKYTLDIADIAPVYLIACI